MQKNVRQEEVPPQGLALTVMAFAVFVSRKARPVVLGKFLKQESTIMMFLNHKIQKIWNF